MSIKSTHLLTKLLEEFSDFKDNMLTYLQHQAKIENTVTIKETINNVKPYFVKLTYHEATLDISEIKIIEKQEKYYSGEYYKAISIKTKNNSIVLTYIADNVENTDSVHNYADLPTMRDRDFKELSSLLIKYSKKINNETILTKNIKAI
jgi:hypothetical protein